MGVASWCVCQGVFTESLEGHCGRLSLGKWHRSYCVGLTFGCACVLEVPNSGASHLNEHHKGFWVTTLFLHHCYEYLFD